MREPTVEDLQRRLKAHEENYGEICPLCDMEKRVHYLIENFAGGWDEDGAFTFPDGMTFYKVPIPDHG